MTLLAPHAWAASLILFATPALRTQTPPQTLGVPFTSHEGLPMFGKLTLPNSESRYAVVIYVQTAEGATVDMKRPSP